MYTYLKEWVDPQFNKDKPIMFDTETTKEPFGVSAFGGTTRLVQIAQDGKCYIYDTFYMNIEDIKSYLKDCHIVAHNILYDLSCIDFQRWQPKSFDDTMHMARHILPHLESFSFKSLAKYYRLSKGDEGNSDWSKTLTESQLQYAADDVIELEKMYYKMDPEVAQKFFTYRLDIKNLSYALRYQLNGLPIHNKNRQKMLRAAKKSQKDVLSKLPADLNINSPKQVCEFLGSDSSSSDVLSEMITDGDENAKLILEARRITKQIQFLEEKFDASRIYGFFKPSGAKTGRWTCSKLEGAHPQSQNLQQLPRDMKSIFGYHEDDERWLVDADYQSLEIFTVIGCMGEENMADIIRSGKDFHKSAAALVYKKDFDDITKTERTLVKGLNFSLLYGAGAKVAQKMMGSMTGFLTDLDIIEDMKVRWLDAFPNIKKVHAEAGKVFQNNDWAICHSPLGRPMRANSYTEYLAMPPQSTGADATKIAIHLIYDRIPNVRIVNTVHDSITIECFSKEEAEETSKIVKECMDESWKIMLPHLKVENMYMNNVSEVVKNLGESS